MTMFPFEWPYPVQVVVNMTRTGIQQACFSVPNQRREIRKIWVDQPDRAMRYASRLARRVGAGIRLIDRR